MPERPNKKVRRVCRKHELSFLFPTESACFVCGDPGEDLHETDLLHTFAIESPGSGVVDESVLREGGEAA